MQTPWLTKFENAASTARQLRQATPEKYDAAVGAVIERISTADPTVLQQAFYNWRTKVKNKSADRYFTAQHLQTRIEAGMLLLCTDVPKWVKAAEKEKDREIFKQALAKMRLNTNG